MERNPETPAGAGPVYDVVVAGCGIAGLSAALSAREAGARVAVLERAPREERGGNTRYTESFWRMKSEDAVSDDFLDRFAANSGGWPDPGILRDAVLDRENRPALLRALGAVDPDVVARIAEEAPGTLKWLKGFGVRFDFLPLYFLSQSTTRMGPVGGGLALVEALGAAADADPGVDFLYETAARGLLLDGRGAAVGLRAVGPGGAPREIRGRSVVLACGGFEGNPEMLSRYIGPAAQYIRPVARGGHYNRGEGVAMALAAGAAPCGDYGSFHAQPVDPRSADIEPVVLNYNYGVLVNDSGRRFADEGPGMVDATYEETARAIVAERRGIAFAVHDAGLDDVANWPVTVRSRVAPHEAGTLEGLADAMGIDGRALRETVEGYNAACPPPDGFDPLRPDGLATAGIAPGKSNWARPVARPPFRAWPIICANCFTFGGVKIDGRARAIDTEGNPIPGLYAAGEVAGLYYRTYTGATSVMRGAVTGRLAGLDAARRRNDTEEPSP